MLHDSIILIRHHILKYIHDKGWPKDTDVSVEVYGKPGEDILVYVLRFTKGCEQFKVGSVDVKKQQIFDYDSSKILLELCKAFDLMLDNLFRENPRLMQKRYLSHGSDVTIITDSSRAS